MGIIVNIIMIIGACAVAALLKQVNKASATKPAQQPTTPIDTNTTSSIDLSGRQTLTIADLLNKLAESEQDNNPEIAPADHSQEITPTADDKNTHTTAVDSPKTDSNQPADIEFDLAKAVVYSEILTPKFKDEDF